MATQSLASLLKDVRGCNLCAEHLPHLPRPVFQMSETAKILIASQAPGRRVHQTGVPFDDPSGDRLRVWMGIDREIFYDATRIAILPMGFCYPGPGKHGDLPPRPECAEAWRQKLLLQMPNIQLTLVIGQYAQDWHLGKRQKDTLADTVKAWKEFWPAQLPLPHPSPRNNIWLRKNPWFEKNILWILQERIQEILSV